MAISHSTALRAALAEAVNAFVDTGAGTAVLRLLDISGNPLIDFPLPNPAYSSDSAGTISLLGTPISALASATGTISTFRVLNRDGTLAYAGTVSTEGGAGDLQVTNLSLVSGRRYAVLAHTYKAPV